MKIYVYAICKNEEQFVDRFMDSMVEADGVYVLDTGSLDQTVKKLKQRGAIVHEKVIDPWRFDVARNLSLEFVPLDADICVCVDLDEVFEKGWRLNLEKTWTKDTNKVRYLYHWHLEEEVPKVSFYIEKIHDRHHYKWTHPVHEVLTYTSSDSENVLLCPSIVVKHYPDSSKSRSSYLPLLELSVLEDPEDDRNMHYLGREYMYYKKWDQAIETLHKHLQLKRATWKDERCASMRFMARCYLSKEMEEEAEMWYLKAIEEAPYLKDAYVELAIFYYQKGWFERVIDVLSQTLSLGENRYSYMNEIFTFDGTIEDLLSVSYFQIGQISLSYDFAKRALLKKPDDERIQKNIELIEEELRRVS